MARRPDQPAHFASHSTPLLDAMSNTNRLIMLDMLAKEEIKVGDLSERLGLSHSATSQHLGILRRAGLVNARRDAQTIFYSTSSASARSILDMLKVIFDGEDADAEAA